jgi:REP element-mobilizing transposase RayT
MSYHERRLPHWDPEDAALFLTWRLRGSLPHSTEILGLKGGARFAAADRLLNRAATGPHWLAQPEVAACVAQVLRYCADTLHLYDLRAWVMMSNHVHILIDPHTNLSQIAKAIKNYSARKANEILGRTGEPFWLDEYYDHWARTEEESERIVRYIEFNPVSAGLVSRPEDWIWSSASRAGQEACPTLAYPTQEKNCER